MKMASNLLNLHNFWSQPESRGLITKRLINEFTIDLTSHPTDSKRAHIWAKYTMDCYLSAFYEIIWLNRNEHTFNTIIGEETYLKKNNNPEDPIEKECKKRKQTETKKWKKQTKNRRILGNAHIKKNLLDGNFINIIADAH